MLSSLAGNVRTALLVWAGLAWAAAAAMTQNAVAQETPPPYRLQPGDTILVSVLEDPELDREVLILPDGRISLPVAGSMIAAGRTPVELQSVIRGRLRSNFVKPPSVTVAVSELAPESEDDADLNEVFVLGEVASPGRYEYDAEKPISVMKALSLAGGLGPFAARGRIQVREAEGQTERMRLFDYDSVEDGLINTVRDLDPLQDGAVIVVPERGLFE